MPRSDVYLVSSRPVEDGKTGLENAGFSNTEKQAPDDSNGTTRVVYSPSTGVDIMAEKQFPSKPYRGMGKEDLLHFSSQPFWRRLRMACIAFVVIAWLALVITVVALVLVYPGCRDPASRSWWQTEVVYRIYVPSFKDSDGDGIGDLTGVMSKLGYLKDLGIGIISLSPIYDSFGSNFATDSDSAVVDHTVINAHYGGMDDFEKLVKEVHDKGMYLILDFIPNHTSDQHAWFQQSRNSSDKNNAFRNYYVWENGNGVNLPNNWKSAYDGSAWSSGNAPRNQFYYHHFTAAMPDLNLRSAQVQQELEAILQFWLDKGVDGFNVVDSGYLYEDYDLRDEPPISGSPTDNYADYNHSYTQNQPETYSILNRWRALLQSIQDGGEKILMSGLEGGLDPAQLYGTCERAGVQIPLNSRFTTQSYPCDGNCIFQYVSDWMTHIPTGGWANWMAGDETTSRFASRFNTSFIQAYTVLTLLLPGTPVLYYGDEINMVDGNGSSNPWQRSQRMRTIMQWENATDAGFQSCNTTCSPVWFAVNDFENKNVKLNNGSSGSQIRLLQDLIKLRREPSFKHGDYYETFRDNNVFSFVREFDGETGYLVALNFGENTISRDFTGSHATIQSTAVVSLVHGASYSVDDEVDTSKLELGPFGAVVVSWDYVAKEL